MKTLIILSVLFLAGCFDSSDAQAKEAKEVKEVKEVKAVESVTLGKAVLTTPVFLVHSACLQTQASSHPIFYRHC
jgi:PBP1b-binding outer membrane lipoprotein LpoB